MSKRVYTFLKKKVRLSAILTAFCLRSYKINKKVVTDTRAG